MHPIQQHSPLQEEAIVLTKALLNMAKHYGLNGRELGIILGLSTASTSRLHQGKKYISPDTKAGELALLLLRLYRSLNTLLGHNHEKARLWLTSDNHYFGQPPLIHIHSLIGLVEVVNYLDAMRAKV